MGRQPSKRILRSCLMKWVGTPTTTQISQGGITTSPLSRQALRTERVTISRTCRNCRQVGNWNHRNPIEKMKLSTTSLEIGAIIAKPIARLWPGLTPLLCKIWWMNVLKKRRITRVFADAIKARRRWMFEAFKDPTQASRPNPEDKALVYELVRAIKSTEYAKTWLSRLKPSKNIMIKG